jgi:predicted nucleotidyltransferase
MTIRPSIALSSHRDRLLALSAKYSVRNPRVFGSTLRGDDREGSDLDLLVDAIPEVTTLLDLSLLGLEAEALLGVPVDIRTPEDIHESFRNRVIAEARPL